MARDIVFLHDQSDKILSATISLRKLSDLAFTEEQILFLFSRIILLLNQLSVINLLDILDRLIKQ